MVFKTFELYVLQIDKYVLKHQEQDSGGEVKTELYKGDVMLTRTGGASVKFTDIEKLKHDSPKLSRRVTRSMAAEGGDSLSTSVGSVDTSSVESEWTDTETRVSIY